MNQHNVVVVEVYNFAGELREQYEFFNDLLYAGKRCLAELFCNRDTNAKSWLSAYIGTEDIPDVSTLIGEDDIKVCENILLITKDPKNSTRIPIRAMEISKIDLEKSSTKEGCAPDILVRIETCPKTENQNIQIHFAMLAIVREKVVQTTIVPYNVLKLGSIVMQPGDTIRLQWKLVF